MGRLCIKCGPDVPEHQFNKHMAICDDCYEVYDMGRFDEARPKKKKKPTPRAQVTHLSGGKLGVRCPVEGCGHKVMRGSGYYTRHYHYERCPKCMTRYFVRRDDCEQIGSPDSAGK